MRVTISAGRGRSGRGEPTMEYVLYIGEREVSGWIVFATGSILLFGKWNFPR
jgi:hypothetical protein